MGYRIVLDDPVANPELRKLVRFADAVKINFGHEVSPSLSKQIAVLKSAGLDLMADRIESYDVLRSATKQGFTQFQGTFFSRPDAFRRRKHPLPKLRRWSSSLSCRTPRLTYQTSPR